MNHPPVANTYCLMQTGVNGYIQFDVSVFEKLEAVSKSQKMLPASIATSNIQYHYLAVIGFNEYIETLSWTIGPWHCTAAST